MIDQTPRAMTDILAALARRQRLLSVVELGTRGLLAGLAAAAVVAAIAVMSQAGWLQTNGWRVLWSVPALATIGAIVGLLRPVNALALARSLDRAAAGHDRFASALQLAGHHRVGRAQLVREDAISAVSHITPVAALPLRTPRDLRYVPLPVLALALLFWLAPGPKSDAQPLAEPEVPAEEWTRLQDEFQKALGELPPPKSPEERELAKKLEALSKMLKENPQKKDVLEKIARLKSELEKRRQGAPDRNQSMKRAAMSMRSSAALKPFASKMREGQYKKASDSLKQLAEKIRKNAQAMTAEDFESAASDMDRMAGEMDSSDKLAHACKNCAGAAGTMDRDKLADALDKLARELESNSEEMEECDRLCKAGDALDELKDKLNKCKKCGDCEDGNCNKSGCTNCNSMVKRNNKKSGKKAGWGTADKWDGGQMARHKEQRTPELAQTRERSGRSTNYKVISKDEKAQSTLPYKEVYADFVHKAEADLALEAAPPVYREYLKKYFTGIRPTDDDAAVDNAKPAN